MTDADLRERERAARQGEPGSVDAFVAALRRAGEDERAWWEMVADVDRRAAVAEKLLGSVARQEPYDVESHHAALVAAGKTVERAAWLRTLDGRLHLEWKRGQRVRIVKGLPEAKPPEGSDARPRPVALGTEGALFYLAHPPEYRRGECVERERKLAHYEVAAAGRAWRAGVRLEDGWVVFTVTHNLERVVCHAWDVLDSQAAEATLLARGELPEKGAKVKTQVRDPKDGLMENIVGRVCWAGVRNGEARVGIERRGKPTVWVPLETVEVLGPPPPPRCVRVRSRR